MIRVRFGWRERHPQSFPYHKGTVWGGSGCFSAFGWLAPAYM